LQIVFTQRDFRCATVDTTTRSVAMQGEALSYIVEVYCG